MEAKLSRRRRTQEEVQDLLKEFDNSGLPISTFCLERQIKPATFHQWIVRKNQKQTSADSAFSSLEIIPSANALFAEVGSVRLYQPVPASFLKELAG